MIRFRCTLSLLLCLAASLVVSSCSGASATATLPAAPGLELQDCQLSAPGMSVRIPAKCGQLSVYEDRTGSSGRQINLNFAVIPAVSRDPASDPLFFLAGGPGQAATESYPHLYFAFERIHQKRDIVLVDQRGTGKSNPLTCPVQDESEADLQGATLQAYLKDCLSTLEWNPRFYTTSIAVDDLDDARKALGYDHINLYGVSYGTRTAMTYLRQHPEHVRSVILDGVVPLSEALGSQVAGDAQRALDLIFARCESEPPCRQAFPQLKSEFVDLLTQLRTEPVDVSLAHPVTGEAVELLFNADRLASAIRLLSYTQETAALIPLLVHSAASQSDFQRLAAQYLIVASQLGESIAVGMNYSVLCAEDYPFIDATAAEKDSAGTYLGDLQVDELDQICATWPAAPAPPDFKDPLHSDAPALILSGEADPVTPPSNGDEVQRNLPNSLHLVAPGQGHNVLYRGCLSHLAAQFVDDGSVENLDATCVQAIQPMPFFINFTGPIP